MSDARGDFGNEDVEAGRPPMLTIDPNAEVEGEESIRTPPGSSGSGHSSSSSKKKSRWHRPGKGIFTLLMILLTGFGIIFFIPKETQKFALFIFLPTYSAFFLAYIVFLCCVNNSPDEDEQIEMEEMPPALKEHVRSKQRRFRFYGHTQRKNRRLEREKREREKLQKKLEKIVETDRTESEESGNTQFETGLEESFEDNIGLTLTMSEAITVSEPPSPTFSASTDDTTIVHHLDANDTNRNKVVPDVPDFFARTFPGLSKTLEGFESNFHGTVRRMRRQIIQPPFAECREGGAISLSRPGSSKSFTRHGSRSALHVPHNGPGPMLEINLHDEKDVGFEEHCDVDVPPPAKAKAKVNLTGRFKHIHNLNYDAFLKSQNIPLLLRKAANASRPIHIYTHTGDTLRVQVDGIVKGDSTFTINGPPGTSNIRHLKFDDHVSWVDDGQAVQVRKICRNPPKNGATELFVTRMLSNDGQNLMIFSKARFDDGSESLECVQTYQRIS